MAPAQAVLFQPCIEAHVVTQGTEFLHDIEPRRSCYMPHNGAWCHHNIVTLTRDTRPGLPSFFCKLSCVLIYTAARHGQRSQSWNSHKSRAATPQ